MYSYLAYHGGNRHRVIEVPTMTDTYNSKIYNNLKKNYPGSGEAPALRKWGGQEVKLIDLIDLI